MDELERLEEFEETRGKLRIPPDIKPCIAALINGSFPGIREGITAFIVATELFRIGKEPEQVEAILLRCHVKSSKVRSAINSASTGKYEYGCPRLEEQGLCQFEHRSECWWYDKIPRKNQNPGRERDFWRYQWPKKLKKHHTAVIVYLAICEVERKRKINAGSQLFLSRRELSKVSGVSTRRVMQCLEILQEKGLITFRRGRQHKWYGEASRIQRVFPVPKTER